MLFAVFSRLARLLLVMMAVPVFSSCTAMLSSGQDAQQTMLEPKTIEPVANVEEALPHNVPLRPRIKLTRDIMFKVLLAEIAGQRGNIDIAVENYMVLARMTRDPVVIERATRIAVYAGDNDAALEAARLWSEIDPESIDARQVMTVMALHMGDIDAALYHLESILNSYQGQMDKKLWIAVKFLGREKDHAMVMQLLERFMENHMSDPDAIYAYARASARLGDMDRAKLLLERTLQLKPGNEQAIMAYLALLRHSGNISQAISWLEGILADTKNDFSLRLAYARLLTDAKRFDDARHQFEVLQVQKPNNADVVYALGLLYLQINQLDKAEKKFLRLTELKKWIFDANYYLGRIAEERDKLDLASNYYLVVRSGKNYLDANIRLNLILARQGQVAKALDNIRAIENVDNSNRLVMIQAEGEILTNAKRYTEAMALFDKAIEKDAHHDLLYARAMLAEKIGQLNILETDLKKILEEDPNNVTALNALGYTLADRTDRYDEAYSYIRRAYELSPDNFYILDSMGWILYMLGHLDEAVEFLRKAITLRNDPEIAAHLGEVLWVKGNKKAALEVWETALQSAPMDERILKLIERFKP